MAHNVEKELSVSQIYTIDDTARNGGENGLAFLNNAAIPVLVCLVKGLLQRREHRPTWTLFTWIDSLQHFRALTPYLKVFEVFEKRMEGWDEAVEWFQSVEDCIALLLVEVVEHGPFLYFAIEECKIVHWGPRGFALQGFYSDMIQPLHPVDVVLEQIGPECSDVFQVMKHFLETDLVSASRT